MKAVFEREFRSYFSTMTGYLLCAFLLLFAGIFITILCFVNGYPNFEYVLSNMSFVFVIVTPILTMRVMAEERRQKTDQLLYSLPLGLTRVVLGKFFALMAVLAVPTVVMGVYPLVMSAYGEVNLKAAYSCLLAFFLMGGALLAIGLYISSVTESVIASAAICFVVVLVNYYLTVISSYLPSTASGSLWLFLSLAAAVSLIVLWMTRSSVAAVGTLAVAGGGVAAAWLLAKDSFAGLFPALLKRLSVFETFDSFINGELDLTGLFFYISVIAVFLVLTVQSLEKRRWSE